MVSNNCNYLVLSGFFKAAAKSLPRNAHRRGALPRSAH
jgi:hypothetical protein